METIVIQLCVLRTIASHLTPPTQAKKYKTQLAPNYGEEDVLVENFYYKAHSRDLKL
jgi:hypothetical protein